MTIERLNNLKTMEERKVEDKKMSVLHVKVLDGNKLAPAMISTPWDTVGPHLLLRFGENVGVSPAVPVPCVGAKVNFNYAVSFPVHLATVMEAGADGNHVEETAAAVKIQDMWRRTTKTYPPPRTADDYILVLKVIDENDTIGKGCISYQALLKEGGKMCTTVELKGSGLGKSFRKKITGYLNVECTLEDFLPPEGPFPLPTLCLLNNLNTRGGMMRVVGDGGSFEALPTWQIRLWEGGRTFNGMYSHWNEHYKAAQQIFGPGMTSKVIREGLRMQHSRLYSKDKSMFGTCNNHFIRGISSFIEALPTSTKNSTPGMSLRFTYVILKTSYMHFSITGKKTAQDFLSKHALHNNAGEEVMFAGEFFIDRNSERALTTGVPAWIIDNNSGTYAPAKDKLHLLRSLLEFNFGNECPIFALDRSDPALSEYFDVNKVE